MLSFEKKKSSEWEQVSKNIKNRTLNDLSKIPNSVLQNDYEKWQKGIIDGIEMHHEKGKEMSKIDKLLTLKNAIRPDLVDHELYHNPDHTGEVLSEQFKEEWRQLKMHRIDAQKIINDIKTHLTRGEKVPSELTKKAQQILKRPIFEELKAKGLLHEEYMDNETKIDKEEKFAFVEDGFHDKDDAPNIIEPQELENSTKSIEEDFFALQDESPISPKRTCQFCFCKGIMPELHPMNVHLLLHFLTPGGRILSRKQTGLCAKWQRKVSSTIRRAKHLGIISYKKSKYYINFPFESPSNIEYLNQKYQKAIVFPEEEETVEKSYFPTSGEEFDKESIIGSEDDTATGTDEERIDNKYLAKDGEESGTEVEDEEDEEFSDQELEDDSGDEISQAEEVFGSDAEEYPKEFDHLAEEPPRKRYPRELDLQKSNNLDYILKKIDKN